MSASTIYQRAITRLARSSHWCSITRLGVGAYGRARTHVVLRIYRPAVEALALAVFGHAIMHLPPSTYRRAITRLVLSSVVSTLGAIIVPYALYTTLRLETGFQVVLLCVLPWALTLTNMWRHTVIDLMLVQYALVVQDQERRQLGLEQQA
jgi:hypothetical protein